MSKVYADFEQNAGNFELDSVRYGKIVDASKYSEEWVNSALFYDWDNAEEHQEWLNEGDIYEIAAWVDDLVKSWQ